MSNEQVHTWLVVESLPRIAQVERIMNLLTVGHAHRNDAKRGGFLDRVERIPAGESKIGKRAADSATPLCAVTTCAETNRRMAATSRYLTTATACSSTSLEKKRSKVQPSTASHGRSNRSRHGWKNSPSARGCSGGRWLAGVQVLEPQPPSRCLQPNSGHLQLLTERSCDTMLTEPTKDACGEIWHVSNERCI